VVAFVGGVVVAARELRRGAARPLALVLALSPPILGVIVALALVWDPWRGRFLVFGFILAGGSWGLMLRWRWLAWSVAALAAVTTVLVLVDSQSKPIGAQSISIVDGSGVWGKPDWWVQSVLRLDDRAIFRKVDHSIPARASVALATGGNELISPFFGRELGRHIVLVRAGEPIPVEAGWLLAAPGVRPHLCLADWRALRHSPAGWLVARRVNTSMCPSR
jgi:hypothetical protein